MRITICVLLYVLGIYYQQCFGLNFIDLPGFGSDEKAESALMKMDKEKNKKEDKFESSVFQDVIGSSESDDSESDKQAQNKEQSIENRKSMDSSTSSPKVAKAGSNTSTVTKISTEKTTSVRTASSSGSTTSSQPTSSSRTTSSSQTTSSLQSKPKAHPYPPVRATSTVVTIPGYRRHWLIRNQPPAPAPEKVDDKDENIKSKITMLVQQTMHDTEARMKTVQKLKERHREEPPYRVGFILSMIKKSRDVLNELFNVAVKHRDEWKALEQLKIFELIVHTNVDTTNLVRQLVEIHIQSLNTTAHGSQNSDSNKPKAPPQGTISGEPEIPKLKARSKVVLL